MSQSRIYNPETQNYDKHNAENKKL